MHGIKFLMKLKNEYLCDKYLHNNIMYFFLMQIILNR